MSVSGCDLNEPAAQHAALDYACRPAGSSLVDAMGSLLRDEHSVMSSGPGLLRRILEEDVWRHFVTQRGDEVRPRSFEEFVTTRPLKGLGSSIELLQRVASLDPVTLDLLDQAVQGRQGRPPKETVDVINGNRPTGTGAAQALRRLRAQHPELHAQVLDGQLTPHAAAVKAGFRRPTATIPVDTPQNTVRALARRFTQAELQAALAELEDA